MEKLVKFKELGLSDETLTALQKKGFEEPSPIQKETIPLLLGGDIDLIGQAQTGTGKTAAFGLPIIELLEQESYIQALILAPTRELAIQVAEEINELKGDKRLKVLPVYGGQSIDVQLKQLRRGVDVVVGTPGRVIDHINRGTLKINNIKFFVLDEADEMLNMGFVDDVEEILKSVPEDRRMLFFSATMPDRIMQLAKGYMSDYEVIRVKKKELTTTLVAQKYFEVTRADKFEALCRIVDISPDFYGFVFCRTKNDVDEVAARLTDKGYNAEGLHGDVSQAQREKILRRFRNKNLKVMVATDVAARGIDVNDITHVINYSLPEDPEAYVHRIGRTGRAGKEGTAISFVTPSENRKLAFIKRVAKSDIVKEEIPSGEKIIEIKKQRVRQNVEDKIEEGIDEVYEELAGQLLESYESKDVVASLLKSLYKDELDPNAYNQINQAYGRRQANTSRLFVALGKKDGLDKRGIVDFINTEGNVSPGKILDVMVMDSYSFITVPIEEGDYLVQVFKKNSNGRKPLVEKAQDRGDGGGRGRGGRDRGGRGGRDRGGRGGFRGGRRDDRGGGGGRRNFGRHR